MPTPATAYTLTGPSSGAVNADSGAFTVTPNGPYTGTVTPITTGAGTFSPASLTWSGTSDAKTFTYTPTTTGPQTVSVSCNPPIAPLLQSTDVSYLGAFRVPGGDYGTNPNPSYNYGGSAIAYNAAHNSLFLVGHINDQAIGEISIPATIINDSNISNLSTATSLQNFFRPLPLLPNNPSNIGSPPGGFEAIGGLQVVGGGLVATAFATYDGDGSVTVSHFLINSTTLASAAITGLFQVGTLGGGYVGGYMAPVPAEWQASLGKPYITGQCAIDVVTRTSWGPAAFGFDPADLGNVNPVPVIPYVYYNSTHPTVGLWNGNPPIIFNSTVGGDNNTGVGVVFVPGTRTILYMASIGVGDFCYGEAVTDCSDNNRGGKGVHSLGGIYIFKAWAYDALDFLSAKNAQINPWDVVPYATWNFSFPQADGTKHYGGAALDPTTRRIYFSELNVDAVVTYSSLPLIQTFQLPAAPTIPSVTYTSNAMSFSDNFNRADSSTTLGSPWVAAQGVWGISSNTAYNVSGGYNDVVYVDTGISNATVQATIAGIDTYGYWSLVINFSDLNNFYVVFCGLSASNPHIFLYQFQNGVYTQLGSDYTPGIALNDVIAVKRDGDSLSVLQNGVTRVGPVTATFNKTSTIHGLLCRVTSTGSRWDDFSVVATSNPTATSYTLTGPTGGTVNVASSPFTVTPNGLYSGTINPHSTGTGTFSPTSLSWSGSATAQTFTYTPTSSTGSPHAISTTSSPALTNPAGIAYSIATVATSYTLTGPTTAFVNIASSLFTVTPNGTYAGTITITPSGGGLSTPIVLTFSSSASPQTFSITPTATGTVTLTPTNNQSLTNPSALHCTASPAPPSYVTNGSGTDWGTAANWTPAGPPVVGSIVTLNHPMTIGSTTAAILGSSIVGQTCLTINAALTISSGGSLTVRGNVVQANGVAVTLVGASLVQFDSTQASPVTTTWTWQIGTTPISTSGTSNGARARIKSVFGGGNGRFIPTGGGTGGVNLAYCDLIRIGDSTNYAFSANYDLASPTLLFDHCNLYQVGLINALSGPTAAGGSFGVTNCVSIGATTLVSGRAVQLLNSMGSSAVSHPTGPWTISNNDFDTTLVYFSAGFTVSGNTLRATLAGYDYTTNSYPSQTAGPYPVTYLNLSGPSGGVPNADSTTFTVNALGGTTTAAFSITPTVSGISGSFSALSPTTLATGSLTATFTFHPTSAGTGTIALSNTGVQPEGNGQILLPDPPTYVSSTVASFYTLTAPTVASIAGWPSNPFIVAIPAGMTSVSVTITPSDGGAGGSFTPASFALSWNGSSGNPSQQLKYTAVNDTPVTISCSSGGGLSDPFPLSYIPLRSFAQAKAVWDQQLVGGWRDQGGGGATYPVVFGYPAVMGSQDTDNIYDTGRGYHEAKDYLSPNPPAWCDAAIATAVYQNRDLYLLPNGGASQGYYTFDQGLRLHWEREGDPLSLATIVMLYWGSLVPNSAGNDSTHTWVYMREGSYATQIALNAERCGVTHYQMADVWAGWLLGYTQTVISNPLNQSGISNPCGADYRCIACQVFMTGIAMRVLIDYYERYKHNPDTTVINPVNFVPPPTPPFTTTPAGFTTSQAANVAAIPTTVKAVLDYIRTWQNDFNSITWPYHVRAWYPAILNYSYWDRDTSPMDVGGTYGSICSQGVVLHGIYDGPGQPVPNPVLNPYLSQAFSWYALYSGDSSYLQKYEESFCGELATGSVNGITSLDTQKEWNDSYSTGAFRGLRRRDRFLNPWSAATSYTLAITDAASGQANRLSGRFTVKLSGGNVALANPAKITLSDGGVGGSFVPQSVTLTTDEPLAVFRYAPPASAAGTNVTISVTNDVGLSNPASVTYGVTTVAPFVTGISLTPPTTAHGPTEYSPDWTISLTPAGSVLPRSQDSSAGVIMLQIAAAGGATQPTRWVPLSADNPSATFQVYPEGLSSITPTFGQGPTWPAGLALPTASAYTPLASNLGVGYSLRGPSGGPIGVSVPITVSATSNLTGTFTVTFTDGVGGTFTPPTVGLNAYHRSGTVLYTPLTTGIKTISTTNTPPSGTALVNPTALTFTATAGAFTGAVAGGAICGGTAVPNMVLGITGRTDTFIRADNTSSLGTPSDGGSPWVALEGTWGILSNQAYAPSGGSYDVAVLESGMTDVIVQVTIATLYYTGYAKVILNASDAGDYWAAYFGGGNDPHIYLYKRISGVFTLLSTFAGPTVAGDVLAIKRQGSVVTVLQNGVTRLTATDAYNATVTRHGIGAVDGISRFAAFSIAPSSTVFAPAVAGGAVGGGSTLPLTLFADIPVGGAVGGGSVSPGNIFSPIAVGGTVAGGSTSPLPAFTPSPLGGSISGGTTTPENITNLATAGGAVASGSTSPNVTLVGLTAGGSISGGNAAGIGGYTATVAGGSVGGGSTIPVPLFIPILAGGSVAGGAAGPGGVFTPVAAGGLIAGGLAATTRGGVSIAFAGSGYVDCGAASLGSGATALSFWFKTTSTAVQVIADLMMDGTGLLLYLNGGVFVGGFRGGDQVTGTTNFADGNWHSVVLQYAGGGHTLGNYTATIDGVNRTLSGAGTVGGATAESFWGQQGSGSNFTGSLKSMQIFSGILSGPDVTALANGQLPSLVPTHHWTCNDGSDTTLADSGTPGGASGTLTNVTWSTDVPFQNPDPVTTIWTGPVAGGAVGGGTSPSAILFGGAPSGGAVVGGFATTGGNFSLPAPSGGAVTGGVITPLPIFAGVPAGGSMAGGQVTPGNIITLAVAGGTVAGGSITPLPIFTSDPLGGSIGGGTTTPGNITNLAASGGSVAGGSALTSIVLIGPTAGGAVMGGSTAPPVSTFSSILAGGAVTGGSIRQNPQYFQIMAGGAVGGGSALGIIGYIASAPAGGIVAGGLIPGQFGLTGPVMGGAKGGGTAPGLGIYNFTATLGGGGGIGGGTASAFLTPATSYTLSGPNTGFVGLASSSFIVSPIGGVYTGTITPSSGGAGGSFAPSSLQFVASPTPQGFAYYPPAVGSATITTSASPTLGTDPAGVLITATAPTAVPFRHISRPVPRFS